jgi:predicted porin
MQKKLIALAVAGLVSAPAFAQSNVQIYGVVDAGFTSYKAGDNKFRGVESGLLSASRIGFRGTEDLGNGLKAVFTLEYGIDVDTGESFNTRARQSFVGLQGGFGFVGLGRQYSPGHNMIGNLDVMGGSAAFSPYLDITSSTIANGGPGRWNNAISYKSPTMGGFSVEAIYAFGENADQDNEFDERDRGTRYGIGAGYKNGPLKAALVYHNTNRDTNRPSASIGDEDTKEWMIGGGYDFGVVDVNLAYVRVKNIDGFDGDDEKTWYLNGAIPVSSAGKVLLGYAQAKYENGSSEKIKAYTLAYTHNLSKRTTAYAGYTHINNDDTGNFGPISKLQVEDGEKAKGFAIGVRHTF